jgi:hypothetical protein
VRIRNLGPWSGGKEGELKDLRLPFRILIAEQGFTIVHCHVSKLELEFKRGLVAIPESDKCPQCKGAGSVQMHGGLKEKECPRCRGRGWIRRRS